MNNRRRKKELHNRIAVFVILLLLAVILAAVTIRVLHKQNTRETDSTAAVSETEETKGAEPTGTLKPVETEEPDSSSDKNSQDESISGRSTTQEEEPEETKEPELTKEPEQTKEPTPTPIPEVSIELDESALWSDYILFVRDSDWKVLYDRNGYDIMYPASMTKIMTAIVVLENVPDLSVPVTVWQEDEEMYLTADASCAGFCAGEEVSVIDLLYGVMLPSGADACEALARYVAGSSEAFADMMNAKAAELGMENTHFVNCTGLHNENHYSTCSDMAVLLSYALNNDVFRTISSTPVYTCSPTDIHPDGLTFGSTLGSIESVRLENGAEIIGGKTGTEDAAGRCLASYGTYEGQLYLLVTGHADSASIGNMEDAMTLFGSLR